MSAARRDKKTGKIIRNIETLNNILAVKGTRVPPEEEYTKKETAAKKVASCAANSTNKQNIYGS